MIHPPATPRIDRRNDCDVAILGAGPAGLAAALTLRRHAPELSVVVLAGPEDTRSRIGETLPPGAQSLLRSLGVWEPFLASEPLPAYGTCAAWGSPEPEANEFIFYRHGRGWHIDRARFDRMLAGAVERRGVNVVRTGVSAAWRRGADRWVFDVPGGLAPSREVAARFVVDATGRRAHFATSVGATRIADDRLVAIWMTFSLPDTAPLKDTYALVEATALGWWYSSLQPDGRLTVACMTDVDLARDRQLKNLGRWLADSRTAPHTRARLEHASVLGNPVLRAADSSRLDRVTGEDWLATGDAAFTLDPLSSGGVMKALRQGATAAYAVADHLAGRSEALPKFEALVRRDHGEFVATKRDYYRREARWPKEPFWRRRHAQIWLQPHAWLRQSGGSPPVSPLFLTPGGLERLRRFCAEPHEAHEVVRTFVAETPAASDEQVVFALQHLIESGAMAEALA